MTCKLCGEKKKLIKSHIIPESFFRESSGGEGAHLVSSNPDKFPKRAPIGVYDPSILCTDCESRFSQLDNYGYEVFVSKYETLFQPLFEDAKLVGYTSLTTDRDKLHQFLLSVLWRASVSTQVFYSKVNLGPHQDSVKHLIFNYEVAAASKYSVVLARWVSSEEHEPATKAVSERPRHLDAALV
ncbi:MAG: hypothetical protein Q8M37_10165, partial [Nevskia sp.]|nr:hypothetical protein [Nevskia sp.]